MAVEVHILAHQSEADESAPLGTTLLGEAPATLVPTLSTNCARETSPGYPWVWKNILKAMIFNWKTM